ncbi:right-handed parallel beta-helix repeat-containing protein [Pontibacter silvestris]|uniref:Right-handed parallel beta-helix repeat-containing protein n=1 Tax=Pontibacter silvestris TaxID=2305183 RepID=A0ABW4X1I4_9BACT|nr:right-handed parallel beta-helix repeat-containing protein [Pontibacter silvestris]MCC9138201.1 right-handed parallel beta-helix repeat-containing protein [Pontibacter silvestris]
MLLATRAYFALAETYYISATSGDDDNTGTSIDEAWQGTANIYTTTFIPGDIILFEGGQTFESKIYFGPEQNGSHATVSGTEEKPITIGSFGDGRAIIYSGDESGLQVYNGEGFKIKDLIFKGSGSGNNGTGIFFHTDLNDMLHYIHIENVDVSGYRNAGISIMSLDNAIGGFEEVSITRSTVHNNGDVGIITYADQTICHKNFYLSYNIVYNNLGLHNKPTSHTGNGILIGGVDGALVEYCEAFNNGENNSWPYGGPVGIWGYQCNNLVIQFNESHHNKTSSGKDGGGFDLDGGCTNSILQYNYSHDNDGAGYLIAQFQNAPEMKNITIRYNISKNDGRKNSYGAIQLWSTGANGGIQNAHIYNNTVYLTKPATGSPKAIYIQSGGIFNTKIQNNIFFTTDGLELVRQEKDTGVHFGGNNYWSGGSSFNINSAGVLYSSLPEWRNATEQEKLNGSELGLSIDPELEDPGKETDILNIRELYNLSSYKLKATSGMIGKGLNLKEEAFDIVDVGEIDFFGTSLLDRSSFSIGAHQPDASTYPVSISSFQVYKKESHVLLTWETVSEQNNKGFEVQISYDGQSFQSIGFVASHGPDSQVRQQYRFTDTTIGNGTRYYRLKQIDSDAATSYSVIRAVDITEGNMGIISYPNPFIKEFILELDAIAKEPLYVTLTDVTGRILMRKTLVLEEGNNKIPLMLEQQYDQETIFVSAVYQGKSYQMKMLKVSR